MSTRFWAADLMATHSNGISALQLRRQLAFGSYKAGPVCAKLRRSMLARDRKPLAGLVTVDASTIRSPAAGAAIKAKYWSSASSRSRTPVLAPAASA